MFNIHHLNAEQTRRAGMQLRANALFSALDDSEMASLVEHTSLVVLDEGEVLFRQFDEAKHLFLIAAGRVKLLRVSSSGGEKIIELVQPGQTFAEAVMFSKMHVYPVTAAAVESSIVWAIGAARYLHVLQNSVQACFAVMGRMSQRLHMQVAEIERLTLHTATARLVSYLLERVDLVEGTCASVTLDTPKNIIASRLSIVPSTFSRTLAKLVQESLIEAHEDRIDLLDLPRLRKLADDVLV